MWKSGLRLRPFASTRLTTTSRGHRAFLASVRSSTQLGGTWFDSSQPRAVPKAPQGSGGGGGGKDLDKAGGDKQPVDERTLNIGKTIQILQDRMPTLLQSPLPSEILSPNISLVLFPSTHPNLPTVRGRVAYIAALWTAPVAWGRLPSRNLRLQVLSERMIKASPRSPNGEKLIVKWRASSAEEAQDAKGAKEIKITRGTTAVDDDEFCGIFAFEFDEKGRIQTHTIENAEENLGGETSSVITVTEWLLKKAKGQGDAQGGLAWQCERLPERGGKR